MTVPRLLWKHVTPAGDYHAALVSRRFQSRIQLHTHDFFEMLYVLAGTGTHELNGRTVPLQAGDLIFVRPDDRHAISFRLGADLEFVNTAFPGDAWTGFCALARPPAEAFSARSTEPPPAVRVPVGRRGECAQVFQRALRVFHQVPSRLELCAFWSLALPFLLRPVGPDEPDDTAWPAWLRTACWAIRDDANLRAGLARFVELSGVSRAHLSRTLKTHGDRTPTAFIAELRLERAALLLATTTQEITAIAADCGFDSLSYFYRLFGQRFVQE